MATELEIRAKLDTMRSLPSKLEKLSRSIGTTQWPGQPVRYDIPTALSEEDRSEVKVYLGEIAAVMTGSNLTPVACSKARLSLLTKMLLGMPAVGSSSEAAAEARAEMYDQAVSDIAPWAINAAIKRWVRGDVPDLKMGSYNFSFAPAPAVLRAICRYEMTVLDHQAARLRRLLAAVPTARAMDPTPLPPAEPRAAGQVVSMLRRV